MRKVKNYQEFTNEEINLKKALTGVALGASLGLSNPVISQQLDDNSQKELTKDEKSISKNLPSEFIKSTNIEDIRNMESTVSIKVPEDFKAEEAMINASFMMLDVGLASRRTPIGGCIFINTPKIGFYVELKATGDVEMKDWVYSNTLEQEGYSWMTNYGSYTKYSIRKDYYKGTIENQKIFNIGVTKPIMKKNYHCRAYIGCGLTRTEVEIAEKVDRFYSEYTNYSALGYIGNYDSNLTSTTSGTGVFKYENRFNLSGGLLFEIPFYPTGLSFGIGFDTNPGSLNLMFGVSIGSKGY